MPSKFYLPLSYSLEIEKDGVFTMFGSSERLFKSEWGYGFTVLRAPSWDAIMKKRKIINNGEIKLRCKIRLLSCADGYDDSRSAVVAIDE